MRRIDYAAAMASIAPGPRLLRLARAARAVMRSWDPRTLWTWRERHALHRVLSSAAIVARHDDDAAVRSYALACLAAAGVSPDVVSDPVRCHIAITRACAAPRPPQSWPSAGGDA